MNKCPTPQYCSDECPHIISYCGLNSMNDIIIPDNATNGDVIKALFKINGYTPMMFCCTRRDGYHLHFKDIDDDDLHMSVSERWWNAPYKKEGE